MLQKFWKESRQRMKKNLPSGAIRFTQTGIVLVFAYIGFDFGHTPNYLAYLRDVSQFEILYWLTAFGWSAFLAAYAFQLHGVGKTQVTEIVQCKEGSKQVQVQNQYYDHLKGYGRKRLSEMAHQFVLNFLGAIAGWIILYLFLQTNLLDSLEGWEKLILSAVSFLSITGYLPYILVQRGLPWSK